jgi:hypothetical protein
MNNISSSIGVFSKYENTTDDRMDTSVKNLESYSKNYSHNSNYGGNHILNQIQQGLKKLGEEQKNEFKWFKSQEFITKKDLKETERNIMSKISEFAVSQSLFQDRIDVAITDLQGDVQSLDNTIAALQATSGSITAEDQALLDNIQARTSTIADKLDALDALTPPVTGSV